jgi:ubiquinone/menaquinone biosynthesis C-methylase UbiE
MGYIGVPYFNVGGRASIDNLATLCKIGAGSKVLEVGCGTGTNACYLAEKYRCTVVGVDIAEHMVRQATKQAEEKGLSDLVSFQVGDAYRLDFPDGSFDAVVTVFVSQFLEPARAFPEFHRVLRSGGRLGINEMYRADGVPLEAKEQVDASEVTFRELTGMPFTLRTPATWRNAFADTGFTGVTIEEHPNSDKRPYSSLVEEFGGWGKLLGTLWKVLVYTVRSEKMRKKFAAISSTKKTLIRGKETSKYIGYVLCAGEKSLS